MQPPLPPSIFPLPTSHSSEQNYNTRTFEQKFNNNYIYNESVGWREREPGETEEKSFLNSTLGPILKTVGDTSIAVASFMWWLVPKVVVGGVVVYGATALYDTITGSE